ncbi:unnamed protein product, partial [marine sediment metagenome]
MRNVYIVLVIAIVLTVLLVVFAFLFLEREKHRSFFYTIEIGGVKIGHIETDRYKTEDKVIYKSVSLRPKELNRKLINEKLVFDRKGLKLEEFTKESKNFGAMIEALYIQNNKSGTFNFLAEVQSKFSTVSDIVHRKDFSLFD